MLALQDRTEMEKGCTSMTFWKLPDVLRSAIYQYDDTYKKQMKNVVLEDLWCTCWIKYRNSMDCPYCQVVLDHLFNSWGVCDRYFNVNSEGIYWCKTNYFPDNIKFVIDYNGNFCRNMGVSVRVNSPEGCVFNGWVLNETEEKETVWIDNDEIDVFNAIEVHLDHEQKLYVWQRSF